MLKMQRASERRGSVPELPRRHVPQNLVQQGSQPQPSQRQPLVHDLDLLRTLEATQ